eukprot:CAMPEP_0172369030 /NCGR_PEP_ID=MMETSP1060-20121228/30253_1 /TAXON_ID=37318 /ORGANISM="Pseudo-nitzschia pungens, Strain cf. cingulata" /LENGTH=338 /DNA_ID=CAMNT_0013093807 /DNA_START=233 /DNA_END=1249 /DNA_ORIENTATION=-
MINAWEAQQRAMKEQERKAKQEAAQALHGYRRSGLSEEETKLAALREQDRIQKQNAAEQLRGYRGQLSEKEARLAAERQEELRKRQALDEQLRTNGVVSAQDLATHKDSIALIDAGAVSELAAGYASPTVPGMHMPSPGGSALRRVSAQLDYSSPETISKDVSEVIAGYENVVTPNEAVGGEHVSDAAAVPQVTPASSATPSPIAAAPEAPLPATIPPTPTCYISKAMFMFGVLTSSDIDTASPEERSRLVSRYLARANDIARLAIGGSPSFQSILPTLAYPVASNIQKDTNRTDVHRTMVTVIIKFTAPDKATARGYQAKVIELVRTAISDGSFTKI